MFQLIIRCFPLINLFVTVSTILWAHCGFCKHPAKRKSQARSSNMINSTSTIEPNFRRNEATRPQHIIALFPRYRVVFELIYEAASLRCNIFDFNCHLLFSGLAYLNTDHRIWSLSSDYNRIRKNEWKLCGTIISCVTSDYLDWTLCTLIDWWRLLDGNVVWF